MNTTRAEAIARRRCRRSESGQVFVWAALLLPIMVMAAGLTFDVGNMINIRDELGATVDAAALAGAQAMHDTKASETYVRNSVKNVAGENQVPSLGKNEKGNAVVVDLNATNAAGGSIVLGKYDFTAKTFTRATPPIDMSKVNAVQLNVRLSQAAGSLPLAFGRVLGVSSYDTVRTAMAVIASPMEMQPTAPVAVNKDVFTGKVKGFTPPDDIVLSTKLVNDMMWTGFFGGTNAAAVKGFIDNPATIPTLKLGDVINTTTANEGANYQQLKAQWPPNSVMLLPVVEFAGNGGHTTGTVVGFVSVKVDKIEDKGNPKYLDGKVVAYKSGKSSATTIAECFGADCRAFLVN